MLGASDFERVDRASPFFGEIVDGFCGSENKTLLSKMIKVYYEFNIRLKRKLT